VDFEAFEAGKRREGGAADIYEMKVAGPTLHTRRPAPEFCDRLSTFLEDTENGKKSMSARWGAVTDAKATLAARIGSNQVPKRPDESDYRLPTHTIAPKCLKVKKMSFHVGFESRPSHNSTTC
jgi:hypothetical protein